MRQKKGGDVIADIYRNRSSRGTPPFTGVPLSQCHSHSHVALARTNRDVAFHQKCPEFLRSHTLCLGAYAFVTRL